MPLLFLYRPPWPVPERSKASLPCSLLCFLRSCLLCSLPHSLLWPRLCSLRCPLPALSCVCTGSGAHPRGCSGARVEHVPGGVQGGAGASHRGHRRKCCQLCCIQPALPEPLSHVLRCSHARWGAVPPPGHPLPAPCTCAGGSPPPLLPAQLLSVASSSLCGHDAILVHDATLEQRQVLPLGIALVCCTWQLVVSSDGPPCLDGSCAQGWRCLHWAWELQPRRKALRVR